MPTSRLLALAGALVVLAAALGCASRRPAAGAGPAGLGPLREEFDPEPYRHDGLLIQPLSDAPPVAPDHPGEAASGAVPHRDASAGAPPVGAAEPAAPAGAEMPDAGNGSAAPPPATEMVRASGWRVLLHQVQDYRGAQAFQESAGQRLQRAGIHEAVDIVFAAPWYKIEVGSFRTSGEAQRLAERVKSLGFRNALKVRDEILVPRRAP